MTSQRSQILTAVPQSWPMRMEIMKAIRTLADQIEEEERLRRRSEFAAIHRDCQLLAEAVREFRRELHKAGFSPNEPRVPAGNPDGGEWTNDGGDDESLSGSSVVISDATAHNGWIPGAQYAANDPPSSRQGPLPGELPDVPPEQPPTAQAINAFLKVAAYGLAGAILAEEPVGDFILALEAAEWLSQYLPLVYSYLDAPKTLQELQQAALSPQPGYNIHHIVEQTPAAQDGFPLSLIDSPDNLVLIPTLKHWLDQCLVWDK